MVGTIGTTARGASSASSSPPGGAAVPRGAVVVGVGVRSSRQEGDVASPERGMVGDGHAVVVPRPTGEDNLRSVWHGNGERECGPIHGTGHREGRAVGDDGWEAAGKTGGERGTTPTDKDGLPPAVEEKRSGGGGGVWGSGDERLERERGKDAAHDADVLRPTTARRVHDGGVDNKEREIPAPYDKEETEEEEADDDRGRFLGRSWAGRNACGSATWEDVCQRVWGRGGLAVRVGGATPPLLWWSSFSCTAEEATTNGVEAHGREKERCGQWRLAATVGRDTLQDRERPPGIVREEASFLRWICRFHSCSRRRSSRTSIPSFDVGFSLSFPS